MRCGSCGASNFAPARSSSRSRGQPEGHDDGADEADLPPDAAEQAGRLEAQALAAAGAGDFEKAEALFLGAARLQPRTARLHEARAQCLLELEDFGEACAAARRSTWLRPEWPAGYLTFGRALLSFGHLQDAVESFDLASSLADQGADEELRVEATEELAEARALLERHWAEHHDVSVWPPGGELPGLRIRQYLDCGYCSLSGEQGPGGALWAAAVVLAAHIASGRPPGRASWCGARAVELGSGTGLAGLAAAAAGASVLLSDREAGLPVLNANIALNRAAIGSAGGSARAVAYDWLDDPPAEVARGPAWDVVLGADLVHCLASVAPFADALARLVRGGGSRAAVGAPALYAHNPRSAEVDAELREALGAHGLSVRELSLPERLVPVGRMDLAALRRIVLWAIEAQPRDAAEAGTSKRQRR